MKQAFLFFIGFALSTQAQNRSVGTLSLENVPEVPATLMEQLNQYQNVRAAQILDFDPADGKMLITTRFGETNQLHILKNSMGARKQITFFREPVGSAVFCPVPAQHGFIFLKDEGGNEFAQLFWFDVVTGKYKMLTEGGKSQNTLPLWCNNGTKYAYTSTRRNQKDYDIYIGDIASGSPALAVETSGSWQILDWSPDNTRLLLRHYISITKTELWLYDIAAKKNEQLHTSQEEIAYGNAKFSADGKGIFVCTDEGSEFQVLNFMDLISGQMKAITFSLKWDVSSFIINPKRDKIIFSVNENGYDQLYHLTTASLKYAVVPEIPKGVITSMNFHRDGKAFAFSISTAQMPGDIFMCTLADLKLSRWTENETGGLDNSSFTQAELVHYPTFDQVNGGPRQIPAFIYKPKSKKKVPVIISIHGGPEGQSRPLFNSFTSYLTNELGVAVIFPNVRGSSGYGKTYLKLDNGVNREMSVLDIGKLLEWIKTQPDLDADRVSVMGGSYGGYMTLASMVHFNSMLRCGIDVVGISNFVTFLKNTEDYRKDLRRVEYGDERDPQMNAFLEKISPLNNVNKIIKPMLIVQGANDPRVPKTEAEQMKEKLKAQGNETWYMIAGDEGHGFRKKNNIDYYQWTVVMFLQKFLLN